MDTGDHSGGGTRQLNTSLAWLKLRFVPSRAGQLEILLPYNMAMPTQQFVMQASAALLPSVVDSAMDAIITLDENQHIVLFNRAAEKMFCVLGQEMLGQPLDNLIPPEYRTAHHHHVSNFAHRGDSLRQMGKNMVLYGLRANGERFPIEASISKASVEENILLTVILRDVSSRVAAQQALSQAKADLQQFVRTSQDAREEEKRRIARELHDELGQSLTALKLDANWLQTKLQGHSDLQAHVQAMVNLIDRTITSSRRISADLRPLMLDDLGLVEAIHWLCKDLTRSTDMKITLDLVGLSVIEDGTVATAIYRVIQEAINNAVKHAQANQLLVVAESDLREARLTVKDNGIGMSTGDQDKRGSYGLAGIKERVYALDGTVRIETPTAGGTTLTVVIPLRELQAIRDAGASS